MPDKEFLRLLAEKYPNRKAVRTEIINLRAILALPKATEFFLSDIHGEYDAFRHFLRSGSGMIRMRIDEIFGDLLRLAAHGFIRQRPVEELCGERDFEIVIPCFIC